MRTFFRKPPATVAVVLMAMLGCTSQAVASGMLYAASPYNVFMLNNFTSSYTDTQGGLAAGGNINITGYSVASNLTFGEASSQFTLGYTLVAGGSLTASSGLLNAGNAYGYTANVASNFNLNGGALTTGEPQVIDFADAAGQLNSLSTSLAGMATTPGDSCTVAYGSTTTCTATGNNLNIINISDPTVFAGKTINIDSTGTNVTLVINVAGTSDSLGGAGFTAFNNGVTVLFNYYQASTLQLGSSAFTTSLLAPLASVSPTGGGNFDGTLIADNFNGAMEFHNGDVFTGDLPGSVPEPISILLSGTGLILISLLPRKRVLCPVTHKG